MDGFGGSWVPDRYVRAEPPPALGTHTGIVQSTISTLPGHTLHFPRWPCASTRSAFKRDPPVLRVVEDTASPCFNAFRLGSHTSQVSLPWKIVVVFNAFGFTPS